MWHYVPRGLYGSARLWSRHAGVTSLRIPPGYEIMRMPKFSLGFRAAEQKGKFYLVIEESYGVRATNQQCSEAGDICAICQAEFRDAVMLLCQHVFCEECLCLWFDREKTCPLCRSLAVETLRCWKDGTTSAHFQVY
ncbi:hypothetical protein Chor_013063 [Crotalus horridus]